MVTKLIINNIVKDPKWKKIPCSCKKGVIMESYPIKPCIHCKCDEANASIPKLSFKIKDKDDKDIEIKTINLVNGSLDDCIGWNF